MTQPQITVGILSGKEIEFSFPVNLVFLSERKFPGHRKLFIRMGRFFGKGKSTTNYPSFLHKMHMLSLN